MFTGLYNAGVKLEVDQCYIMVVLGMSNTVTVLDVAIIMSNIRIV